MTEEELKHLNHLVRQSKLSRESYLRMIINGLVPRASPSEELIDTILLLRNISNDIYQISINRSTIQRRRHAGLKFIKKFMEDEA